MYFKNKDNENFKFELYDRNGTLIERRRIENSDRIIMDMELKTGVYIFKLSNLDNTEADPIVDQFISN